MILQVTPAKSLINHLMDGGTLCNNLIIYGDVKRNRGSSLRLAYLCDFVTASICQDL